MKPYPAYKDSGIEWIGEIPKHWNYIRFKFSLSSLESGNRETGGGNQLNDGIFSIGGEHIGWLGEIFAEDKKFISEDYYNRMTKGKIKERDVLLVKDGATIGKCMFVQEIPDDKAAVNEHVFLIRANNNYDGHYIFYFIWSYTGQEQIKLQVRGSAQPGLNSQFQNYLFIPDLPLKEQRAISIYADCKTAQIDELIYKKEKIIELLKEERTAIINQAVTKGINPNTEMKDSGIERIGKIPKEWEVNRLKMICTFIYGDSLANEDRISGNIPVYGSNGIVGYHDKAITHKPCIIVGRKGSYGKVNFSNIECFPIDTTYFIDDRSAKCDLKWLNYALPLLELDKFSNDIGVPGLNREYVHNKRIPTPEQWVQKSIAAFLDRETAKIDTLIAKQERLIEALKEYRTALISEVVTGKIDVREYAV